MAEQEVEVAMVGKTKDTSIDITKRLEWVVSKNDFVKLENGFDHLCSPPFKVNIKSQVTNWNLSIAIDKLNEAKKTSAQIMDLNKKEVLIILSMVSDNISLKAEVEGIGIKTDFGYTPSKPCELYSGNKMVSKIEQFNGNSEVEELMCATDACTYEEFLKLFSKNKITVVAILRFYVDRDEYIKKKEKDQNLITQIRSISDLDTLTDFTVICEDREFKCHKVILASRSTIFATMILNDQFVEYRENSVTIENASPDMVEAMLNFMYKGVVPHDIEEKAIDLIPLADRYNLQDLIEICERSLVNTLTVESVIETLIAIDLHVPNSQHRKKILDFVKAEASQVVKSSHWKKFVVKYPDLVTEIVLSLVPTIN